jgi:hypothetical protein
MTTGNGSNKTSLVLDGGVDSLVRQQQLHNAGMGVLTCIANTFLFTDGRVDTLVRQQQFHNIVASHLTRSTEAAVFTARRINSLVVQEGTNQAGITLFAKKVQSKLKRIVRVFPFLIGKKGFQVSTKSKLRGPLL